MPAGGGSTRSVGAISAGADHTWRSSPTNPDLLGIQRRPAVGAPEVHSPRSARAWRQLRGSANGALACWGGDLPYSYDDPLEVPPGTFTAVDAAWFATCAIRADAAVVCWEEFNNPFTVEGPFVTLSVGNSRACAIRSDQTITCWSIFEAAEPLFAPDGAFTTVSVGDDHACGSGPTRPSCAGARTSRTGFAADGPFTSRECAGGLSPAGIRTDATIACWGDDNYLQSSPPAGTFAALDAGRRHACAIRTGGGVACWGRNRRQGDAETNSDGECRSRGDRGRTPAARWSASSLAPITAYDVRYRRHRIGTRWGPWTCG